MIGMIWSIHRVPAARYGVNRKWWDQAIFTVVRGDESMYAKIAPFLPGSCNSVYKQAA